MFSFIFSSAEEAVKKAAHIKNRRAAAKPPAPPSSPARHPLAAEQQPGSTTVLMGLKVMCEIFLSCLVLLCTVFSKLSLVGLASHLGEVRRLLNNGSGSDPDAIRQGVSLYWQLLLILLIPNCITFLRCLLFGFVGKSAQSFPFPRKSAFIAVRAFCCMC